MESTGYHLLASDLMKDLVNHGWGEMYFKVESLKDNSVKVQVISGKSFVFIIKKDIKFDRDSIL